MTDTIIASASSVVRGFNADYLTARNTSSGVISNMVLGQTVSAGIYSVNRLFLKFDTSSVPLDATISRCYLQITYRENQVTSTDFDVQIIEQNWGASDPINSGSMETVYDNCLIASSSFLWQNTSALVAYTTYTGEDMTPGYINKSGNTYYSLRSKRDKDSVSPSDSEIAVIYGVGDSVGVRPRLIIEYAVPTNTTYYFLLRNNRRHL